MVWWNRWKYRGRGGKYRPLPPSVEQGFRSMFAVHIIQSQPFSDLLRTHTIIDLFLRRVGWQQNDIFLPFGVSNQLKKVATKYGELSVSRLSIANEFNGKSREWLGKKHSLNSITSTPSLRDVIKVIGEVRGGFQDSLREVKEGPLISWMKKEKSNGLAKWVVGLRTDAAFQKVEIKTPKTRIMYTYSLLI